MTRRLLILLLVLLAGCRAETAQPEAGPKPPVTAPSPVPTRTVELQPEAYQVLLHPEDGLYVGDLLSFEVIAPADFDANGQEVSITADTSPELTLGPVGFGSFGIGGRQQATLKWVWDTQALDPGDYQLTFTVQPDGVTWTQSITLYPQEALADVERNARWESRTSACCVIYYLSGTASDRELRTIDQTTQKIAEEVIDQLGVDLDERVELVLMPRVLGHGGFASDEIYISYLDRNYAGNNLPQVLKHEAIHILDRELGGELRPTMLLEGFAVYLSEGHFKPEPLFSRAATLFDLGMYLPLQPLADNFYFQQHEIGYLQAGALVEYMVGRWGYAAFDDFYRDIHSQPGISHSEAIDIALQEHFGLSFAELEQQYIVALKQMPINPDLREDTRLTVKLFDSVRRYQKSLDRSAHFLTAWLVTLDEIEERNITADYLRHPSQPENLALETLLISAGEQIEQGEYMEAQRTLAAINAVLDQMDEGNQAPFSVHPLTADYFTIVNVLLAQGYQPQQITLNANSAQVLVSANGPNLIVLNLNYVHTAWLLE